MALPSAAELAQLNAAGFRRQARRRRRRSNAGGWVIALIVASAVCGAGYFGYHAFTQQDAESAAPEGGFAGAIGGAIGAVEGLERRDVAAGLPTEPTRTLAEVSVDDVFPTEVRGVARSIGPIGALQRYVIDVDDLADLQPDLAARWLSVLASLPQTTSVPDVLPVPIGHELVIGLQYGSGYPSRLVVRSVDPALNIDLTR